MAISRKFFPTKILIPLAILAPFLGAAVMVYGSPLAPDLGLYLHLKTGELAWTSGQPVARDAFSFTAVGQPDEVHSWLAQIVFYLLHAKFGEFGLRFLNLALVWGALLACANYVWQKTRSAAMTGFAACAALLVHHSVQVIRPLLFGECFTVLLLANLLREPKILSGRKIATVILLVVLWANLHGSVLIAIPLAAIYCVALWFALPRPRPKSKLVLSSLLLPLWVTLAAFVNPAGVASLRMAWELNQIGKLSGVWEWQSALPLALLTSESHATQLWIGTEPRNLLILIGVPLLLLFAARAPKKKRVDCYYPVAQSFFAFFLAMVSQRHTAYLLFPAAAFAEALFFISVAAHLPRYQARREAQWATLGITLLFVFPVYQSGYALPSVKKSVDFIEDADLKGNLFNFPGWGSYLTYRLFPKIKVAYDRRLWIHRHYFEKEHEQTKNFGGVILSELVHDLPDSDLAMFHSEIDLTKSLGGSDWILIFENNEASIALRRGEKNAANLERVMTYYHRRGVDFDPDKGFDVKKAFQSSPGWVVSNQENMEWGLWPERIRKDKWEEARKSFFVKHAIALLPGIL